MLTTAFILQQTDEKKPFSNRTDASLYALGVMLVQVEGTEEHSVEYASKLLTKSKQNYSTTDREALRCSKILNHGYSSGPLPESNDGKI